MGLYGRSLAFCSRSQQVFDRLGMLGLRQDRAGVVAWGKGVFEERPIGVHSVLTAHAWR